MIICVCIKPTSAWDLSLRWAALDRRLEVTAEKIEQIKSGKFIADLSQKETADGKKSESSGEKETKTAALPIKASALPIDRKAVRESENSAAVFAPAGQPEQTVQAMSDISVPDDGFVDPAETETEIPETEQVLSSEAREEVFKRHILLQDAVDRADKDAYGAAYMARGPALEALWQIFLERDEAEGFPSLISMGVVIDPEDPPPTAAELSQHYELVTA